MARGVTKSTFNPTTWRNINIEKSWQAQGCTNYQGDAWYRRSFEFTPPGNNQRVLLYLGGAGGSVAIYLNGVEIEKKPEVESKLAFAIDVTDKIQTGRNVLVLQVASSSAGQSGLLSGVSLLKGIKA